MLDVYDNLDGLNQEDINDFFNSETSESLLLGLIQLIKEKLFFNPLDIKGALLTSSEDIIIYLVFGLAFSELTFSSIIGSFLLKKGHELHHLYYVE